MFFHNSSRGNRPSRNYSNFNSDMSNSSYNNRVSPQNTQTQPLSYARNQQYHTPSVKPASTMGNYHGGAPQRKKKRANKQERERSSDFVLISNRPVPFPFHNDCHFLPTAEADPRDVDRLRPEPNRRPGQRPLHKTSSNTTANSYQSGKTSMDKASSKKTGNSDTSLPRSEKLPWLTMPKITLKSLRQIFGKSSGSMHKTPDTIPRSSVAPPPVDPFKPLPPPPRSLQQPASQMTPPPPPLHQSDSRILPPPPPLHQFDSQTPVPDTQKRRNPLASSLRAVSRRIFSRTTASVAPAPPLKPQSPPKNSTPSATTPEQASTSGVGRLWKRFKNAFVKNSARVDIS